MKMFSVSSSAVRASVVGAVLYNVVIFLIVLMGVMILITALWRGSRGEERSLALSGGGLVIAAGCVLGYLGMLMTSVARAGSALRGAAIRVDSGAIEIIRGGTITRFCTVDLDIKIARFGLEFRRRGMPFSKLMLLIPRDAFTPETFAELVLSVGSERVQANTPDGPLR